VSEPIVGTAEDFTIEVLTEIGAKIRHSALDHVNIDDDHLLQEAKELPQLLFYYQAAWCRLCLRAAQKKIQLDEAEANAYLQIRSGMIKVGDRPTADELKYKITLEPTVQALVREHAEIEAKSSTVQGILHALRQKGYSMQLVASIRGKESDWLASSFMDRFADHPQREKIANAFNQITGHTTL
jgi:hypothetical protein